MRLFKYSKGARNNNGWGTIKVENQEGNKTSSGNVKAKTSSKIRY